MTKAETIFQKELQLIHDKNIKQFVIQCFDKLCPDYFWTCPCSTSGKYHSQVSLGVGGLVRHTKLAVWWGVELLRALDSSPELKDIATLRDEVIATLLLHDMVKNGKGLNAQGYSLESGVTGTHGVTLANKIVYHEICIADSDSFCRIMAGVAGHMGVWTTNHIYQPNNILDSVEKTFAQLIHLADYAASRKVDDIYSKLQGEKSMVKILKRVDYSCPMSTCKYTCSLDMKSAQKRIKDVGEFAIPPYMCPNPENNHECHNPDSVGLNINLVFGEENKNDTIKQTTDNIKTETPKSPPCPGVRKTESC